MKTFKQSGYSFLMKHQLGKYLLRKSQNIVFPGSAIYWENRYRNNGNSGSGSYGKNAAYKAKILNQFVAKNNILTVIEFGCGDGNQLKQFYFPTYTGLDVSITAIEKCKDIFIKDKTKKFFLYEPKVFEENIFSYELALSLDVIYHLVEDEVFENYMQRLFSTSSKYVIIYAWNVAEEKKYHVRHRNFTEWIEKNITGFQLKETISKESFCDFFIYEIDQNRVF